MSQESPIVPPVVPPGGIPTPSGVLGSFVIEVTFAVLLYGTALAQSYVYMLNSDGDPLLLKAWVFVVWFLETAHTGMTIHMLYLYTVVGYGNLASATVIVLSVGISIVTEMIIVALVQGFYIRRIWILSRGSIALTAVTSILLLCRIAFGLATASLTYSLGEWSTFREKTGPLFTISAGLGLSAVVDALIAIILIYCLRKGRSGFAATDNIIRTIITYVVNTGAVNMIVSVVTIFTFAFLRQSLAFGGFVLIASKLYANSFLGTLNSRSMLRNKGSSVAVGYSAAELSTFRATQNATQTHDVVPQAHIQIYRETQKVSDPEYSSSSSWPGGKLPKSDFEMAS
ncbi:unnamed protein product [Somion occarium]|uniref:DUF6534 domain-containing protein n=1 Tax=Somion occarium TaxID=3059160 RepID=A0ABP1DA70_9APHY